MTTIDPRADTGTIRQGNKLVSLLLQTISRVKAIHMIHTRLTSTNLGARALRDVRHIAGLTLAKVDQTDENVESDLRVSGGHVNFCERARQGSKLVDV
ncbi:hypothetical protein [Corynebacterium lehmanniae]